MAHINEEQSRKWQQMADKLREASRLVQEVRLELLLNADDLGIDLEGKAVSRVSSAENSLSGLGYLFTPQSEWMGGDSLDPVNFKTRRPHIAS